MGDGARRETRRRTAHNTADASTALRTALTATPLHHPHISPTSCCTPTPHSGQSRALPLTGFTPHLPPLSSSPPFAPQLLPPTPPSPHSLTPPPPPPPAMPTVAQLRGLSLLLLLSSLVLLIASLALPQFVLVHLSGTSPSTSGPIALTVDGRLGAFQMCFDVSATQSGRRVLDTTDSCGTIDNKCEVSIPIGSVSVPSGPMDSGTCADFNIFRGLMVTGVILLGAAVLCALYARCSASPHPHGVHVVVVLGLVSALCTLIALLEFTNGQSVAGGTAIGLPYTAKQGPSVYLAGFGAALAIIGTVGWAVSGRYGGGAALPQYLLMPMVQGQGQVGGYPVGGGVKQPLAGEAFYAQNPAPAQQPQYAPASYQP